MSRVRCSTTFHPDDPKTMIALLGRAYDRLAQHIGQTMAGAVVLAAAGVVWLVLAWALGDW